MHDPLIVAFEIRRPWPKRNSWKTELAEQTGKRWEHRGAFTIAAGRGFYWPTFITVWHHDPSGYDTITCPIGRNDRWRFHVHHWRIQVAPLQQPFCELQRAVGPEGRPLVAGREGPHARGLPDPCRWQGGRIMSDHDYATLSPEPSEMDQLRADNESLRYMIERARWALGESVDERLLQAQKRVAVAEHETKLYRDQMQALIKAVQRDRGVPEEALDGQAFVVHTDDAPAPLRTQKSNRPTHPDGTPFGYADIVAGGWSHCDGCRTWSQSSIEQRHDCPMTYIQGPFDAPPQPKGRS